jgi:hypothetical protein
MGSAVVVPPPPGILRVYHFTSAEFAKDDIVHRRVKVARISELNDPFEFLALQVRQMWEKALGTFSAANLHAARVTSAAIRAVVALGDGEVVAGSAGSSGTGPRGGASARKCSVWRIDPPVSPPDSDQALDPIGDRQPADSAAWRELSQIRSA